MVVFNCKLRSCYRKSATVAIAVWIPVACSARSLGVVLIGGKL